MKTEVYSWRVSTEMKTDLEREARRRDISLSAALDLAAKDWLTKTSAADDPAEEQQRLHRAASECLGALSSGDASRSEKARQAVKLRLRRQRGR
jgi:hypothetical protein